MSSTFVVAIWMGESMWAVVSTIGMFAILIPPFLNKDITTTYNSKLMKIAYLLLFSYLVLSVVQACHSFQGHWVISIYLQTVALMVFGYMIMISIDINTETILSKRWMMLFSIAFALAFTVLHTFFQYYFMSVSGYLVTGDDFLGGISPTSSNRLLMAPMMIASLTSLINSVILRRFLATVPKSELTLYYGGQELG